MTKNTGMTKRLKDTFKESSNFRHQAIGSVGWGIIGAGWVAVALTTPAIAPMVWFVAGGSALLSGWKGLDAHKEFKRWPERKKQLEDLRNLQTKNKPPKNDP